MELELHHPIMSMLGGARRPVIRLTPPEHSCIVHCNQDHYGPVSGGSLEAGVKVDQEVVGEGRLGLGGDADGGPGGGMDGGGG